MTIVPERTDPALAVEPPVEPLSRPTLDKRLVHKSHDHNVLVSRIERVEPADQPLDEDGYQPLDLGERFVGTFYVHQTHDFFFEHPRQHVPGLYLIEAGRQMSVAIAHMFYGVPFGVEFVMIRLIVEFLSPANITDPLTAHSTMSKHLYRKGQLVGMQADGIIRQNDLEIARMAGTMVLMDPRLLGRLERRTARV